MPDSNILHVMYGLEVCPHTAEADLQLHDCWWISVWKYAKDHSCWYKLIGTIVLQPGAFSRW